MTKIYLADTKRSEVFVFEQNGGYMYPVEKLVVAQHKIKSIDITKYHHFSKPMKKSVFDNWKKRHRNFVKKHNRDTAIKFLEVQNNEK